MKEFAVKLRELRLERGWTQAEVARAIGLSKNALTNYETGIREPSLEKLKDICVLFGVSADYLIGLEDKI